jgi:ABC transport system ATP-binding/permease protein
VICVDAERVGVAQPDKVLFEGLSVTISRGDRVAVVGVNGSGKTTLLRILTGAVAPDEGVIRFGRGVRIASLEQDPRLPPGTVAEFLGDSWEVAAVATSLGVQPLLGRRTEELSGGQAKRVALAKVLVGEHDLIVVDEPTNHLDLEAIEWLEERLLATPAAIVLVTHDRHVLDRLTVPTRSAARGACRVVEIERGRAFVHTALAAGSAYATYLEAQADRAAREASEESTRRILARRELAWLRRGAPARSTKPKARLRAATEIVSGGPESLGVRGSDLTFGSGSTRLGNQVVELEGVAQQYGDHVVLRDVDLLVEPGARLGVVGPNGSGKSTLLDIVAGRRQPTSGTVRRGSTVVTGYADQHSSSLDPDAIVRELVAGPLRRPDHTDRALLERFWFDSTAQYAPVRMLSGGERRRLELVMVLAAAPNLLVLDEPTNDLDLDTLRALEEFLDGWPGALVVASHDRAFLDRTVDHILEIADGGAVRRVPGGVAGWLASRRAVVQAAAGADPVRAATTSARAPSGPSPSTLGRRLRETEMQMAKVQRRRDQLTEQLHVTTDHRELAALGASPFTEGLNPDQLDAVVHEDGPLLVVAGAGSGKTRVLTHRIAHLIDTGRRPSEILAITFTNKAAAEMRERVGHLVGPVVKAMWVSTFHSACVRILRRDGEALGYPRTFSIYDQADAVRLTGYVIRDLGLDPKRFTPRGVHGYISLWKNELKDPERAAARPPTSSSASTPTSTPSTSPPPEGGRDGLRRPAAQRRPPVPGAPRRARALPPALPAHPRRRVPGHQPGPERDRPAAARKWHQNVCVVGDTRSIGVQISRGRLPEHPAVRGRVPEVTTIVLDQNYRSTQTILDAANAVIEHNLERKPKHLWTDTGGGDRIVRYHAEDEGDEAMWVAGTAQQLHRDDADQLARDGGALPHQRPEPASSKRRSCGWASRTRWSAAPASTTVARSRTRWRTSGRRQPADEVRSSGSSTCPSAASATPASPSSTSTRRDLGVPSSRRCGAPTTPGSADRRVRGITSFVDLLDRLGEMVGAEPTSARDDLLQACIDESGYLGELEAEDTVERTAASRTWASSSARRASSPSSTSSSSR